MLRTQLRDAYKVDVIARSQQFHTNRRSLIVATVNVGINGFGRIGRLVFRQMAKCPESTTSLRHDLTDTKRCDPA